MTVDVVAEIAAALARRKSINGIRVVGIDGPSVGAHVIGPGVKYSIADRSCPPNDAGMTITQLDPADSVAMGQWYDLMVVVTRHDLPDFPTPSRQEHRARFEHAWPH